MCSLLYTICFFIVFFTGHTIAFGNFVAFPLFVASFLFLDRPSIGYLLSGHCTRQFGHTGIQPWWAHRLRANKSSATRIEGALHVQMRSASRKHAQCAHDMPMVFKHMYHSCMEPLLHGAVRAPLLYGAVHACFLTCARFDRVRTHFRCNAQICALLP